jgi:predicted nucleotidyltransferase
LKEFESEYPILKISLIGSILTKRYRNDADLDINVLFNVPVDKQEEERTRLSKKYLSVSNPDNIQGELIPGSEHPINFYFITDKETYDDQNKKADAVFDIKTNKFVKKPDDFTFDVSLYIKDFNKKVEELDVIKGELKRDIIDYDELKELEPNDILNLQDRINSKLEEIEDSINDIIKVGDGLNTDRRAAFDTDMSPDQIQKYGIKNRLPKNVIYKMLEKYHYLNFYKKCKKILDDGKVTDAEIDSLKEATGKSIAFAFGRFNPPTVGHEKLISKVASLSTNDYKIYLSRSQDPKKNPLTPRKKLDIMKKMFPRHSQNIEINTTNMVLDIATLLHNKGYTDVTMVAGSDRVREFEDILKKYNGVKSRHGLYDFENIKVDI